MVRTMDMVAPGTKQSRSSFRCSHWFWRSRRHWAKARKQRLVFGSSFWDDLATHPEVSASFDELMGPPGHGVPNPNIDITGGWDAIKTVVDVGGGTGALLASVLGEHRAIKGILVDLPQTIARSAGLLQAAGVADRVTTTAQSFFDPLPSGADLYFLKSVLGDWPDREAIALLRRCADAAGPSGRVILLGGVEPDSEFGAYPDLLMLVLVGGKSRTLTGFRELAREAGLEVIAAAKQQHWRFVVECRPI